MKKLLLVSVVALTVCLVGCGGNSSSTSSPTTQLVAGNWSLQATSTVFTGNSVLIGGPLSASNGTVTGMVHILDPSNCYNFFTDIPVSGTINSNNQVSITSGAEAGQVIAATLQIPASGTTMTGTYSITGTGCASGDSGRIAGNVVPNTSGTWSGSIQSSSGGTVSTSGSVTQSNAANSDGVYPVSGGLTFANSPCFSSGTILSGSFATGGVYDLNISTSNGTLLVLGILNDTSTGKNMAIAYEVSGGTCSGDSGSGTLTRP